MKNMTDIELADAARDLLRQLTDVINTMERRGVNVELEPYRVAAIGGATLTRWQLLAERVERKVL